MDKDQNRPKTFKTIATRVTALVLAVWLTLMLCLTWAVAKDFYNQIHSSARELAVFDWHVHYNSKYPEDFPGARDISRSQQLAEAYTLLGVTAPLPFVLPQTPDSYGSDDWFYGKWNLLYGFQPAVIFYGENEKNLMKSGNIFSFSYCSETTWASQSPEVEGFAWIDMDAMPGGGKEALDRYLWGGANTDPPSNFFLWDRAMRLTGYFEDNQFFPVSIDIGVDTTFPREGDSLILARRDGRGLVQWDNIYTTDAPEGVALTTLYSWEIGGYSYDHKALTANGTRYDSLVDYLDTAMGDERWYNFRRENLFDSIIIFSGTLEDDPEVARYALAVRCWPMHYAALRLIPAYLVSLALVGLALWLILRSIRWNVTEPMDTMIRNLTHGYPIKPGSDWQEPRALETILKSEQEQRWQLVNDNRQLQTSLEYARNAEENRRQLVSNITHELKTPLAIIHSYAEALQSGIGAEKRDKYLATILEESERMDGMVLEMLDFSRLESGKVRLSADHFSLLKLTEGIAEKLTTAAEARQLTITWGFTNDCCLTADESRITQVVTNLLTNAIRYTPEGGHIWLRIFSDAQNATFQIENDSDHLPKDVLEKIFETFYRTDDSRSSRSTGLGLPIARTIVELHRGKLTAQNTWVNGQKCLQFSFSIPLK